MMDTSSTGAVDPGLRLVRPSAEAGAARDMPWYLDPREILLSLRLRRLWLLGPIVVGLLLALAVLLFVPPHYTSTAELLIDPRGLQVVKDDLSPPGQASDASLLLVDSQMQVLASDDVLRRVVQKFGLARDPDFDGEPHGLGALVGRLTAALSGPGAPSDPALAALRTLRQRLSVKRQERTFALVVSVTAATRDRAAQLAQGVADTYLAYDAQTRADLARGASQAISARLGELQAEVAAAEDRAQAFRTANNLVGTRTQLVSEQQLAQISEQLGAAQARAAERTARLAQIEAATRANRPLDTLPEVLQSPTITQLRTQLATTSRALADISTTLSDRHPARIAAAADVRKAQQELNAEVARIVTSVRTDARVAATNVADLTATLDRNKKQATTVGDALVKLRELERQADARRTVYETFLVRARELGAQQQLGTSASRVISPATPPARRDGPPALLILIAALALATGVGVAAAIGAEVWSGRPRTIARLSRALDDVPVLGSLPPAPPERRRGQPSARARSAANSYDLAVARLRTRLPRLLLRNGPRVVLVTAADRRSGKARLAWTLAAQAAADGDRVLLVDADAERLIPQHFDLPIVPLGGRGGGEGERGALPERGVAQAPNLRYCDATRLLSALDARTIADEIRARADDLDLIVVHAAPVGSDLLLEQLAEGRQPAAVLLTASAGRSRLPAVSAAAASFAPPASVGVVLTDAPVSVA